MCYEISNWFRKERARELQRAERTESTPRAPDKAPSTEPKPAPEVARQPEKIPA